MHSKKNIIRIFSKYTEKSGPQFKSLKILNIFELNTYLPAFLDKIFKTNKSVHSYSTQSAPNIHIEVRGTNYGKNSIGFKGAIYYVEQPSQFPQK